jgi:integrase/recombinase XerD
MKKQAKATSTINFTRKALRLLAQHCNLDNPESVRAFLVTFNKKDGYKKNLCIAYNSYVKINGLTWNKPQYYTVNKLPKIPSEIKINMIIANASLKLGTALSISKDTGLRPIEVMNLTLKDIDFNNSLVYPQTAKHGSARVLKLKDTTLNMLNKYIARRNIGLNDRLFGNWNSDTYGKWFRVTRNKLAQKIGDNSLKTIRLYDLRHYFATMLYHNTKDILLVKQQLGHKDIENTLIYTQLVNFENNDYFSAVASTIEGATDLIEKGFEYVTDFNGIKLFRKRK